MVIDTGVTAGNSFVEIGTVNSGKGDEIVARAGRLLVGVGASVGGIDWAAASWVTDGSLGVSPC